MDTTGDPLLPKAFTKERELAPYIQAAVSVGKLDVVGGARMTRTSVTARNLHAVEVFDENFVRDEDLFNSTFGLFDEDVKQSDILPRVLATYRQTENVLVRAGYYLSVARPQVSLLSQQSSVVLFGGRFFGPNGDQRYFEVQKGNPDLKPARTHSFDLNAEYYDKSVGALKLGIFYKRIRNLLESSVSSAAADLEEVRGILPQDPRLQDVFDNPADYEIFIRTPQNNPDAAHIWGIEASLEKQLTFLPGMLSGLGVYANYTFTDSSKKQPSSWSLSPVLDSNGMVTGFVREEFVVPDVRFSGQAAHSGTIGLTYSKYGIDANIAYTMQARRMRPPFAKFNLHNFEEAYGTLDARAEYRFERGAGKYRVYFEGADLLRGPSDASLQLTEGGVGSTPKYFGNASYFGGRQLRIGASVNF